MRKALRAFLWVVGVTGVIVGLLYATVFDGWTVPTDDAAGALAIMPSLAAGDVLMLYRGSSGPGDLVRCVDPDEPRRFVVGRIVAIEGETVELRGDDFSVDGKAPGVEGACSEPKVTIESTDPPTELACAMEAFRGRKYLRLRRPNAGTSAVTKSVKVPAGSYFLMSDNRAFPVDSRDYGVVSAANCKEQVFLRLWSSAGLGDGAKRFEVVR